MLKLFGFQNKSSKDCQKSLVPTLDGDQPYNPFTEITIYSQHKNIVRHLMLINKTRFVSAGDDTLIVIWDLQTAQRVHVLKGHSRPITCLSVLPSGDADAGTSSMSTEDTSEPLLLSAASDKLICIWDPTRGVLLRQLTQHQGTARCFLHIPDLGYFCSGGEKLCLWSPAGDLVSVVDRCNEEDISQIIQLRAGRLVLSVDKRPVVYDINKLEGKTRLTLNRLLTPHREAITSLLKINDTCFASGSLDGTIILWSSHALAPSRYFNSIADYLGDNRILPYSIQAMICLDECYLVCAIGTGFSVYDIIHGYSLTQKKHAHHSKILSLALVHHGTLLATVSEDGSLRLWGCRRTFAEPSPMKKDCSALERLLGTSVTKGSKDRSDKLDLLGECLGHNGTIRVCLNVGGSGILTCGADGLVINWKDGIYENMKRNALLQEIYSNLE